MTNLSDSLTSAVAEKSMLRLVIKLMPASADGLVYPPTYDQGKHLFRPAWIDGEKRDAVLLDSVQSQANRVEEAILEALGRGAIIYPDIELKIAASTGNESYSVLQLSHRVYDASLRMATVDGAAFAQSCIGRRIYAARMDKATALYEHAPITLLLGGWDSHGGGGPLVAKLPRLLTSEIVGIDAQPVTRGATKVDPMDIRKDAGPIYESKDPTRLIEIDKSKAGNKTKEFKPSEKGFGSVPNLTERGAVIVEAIQTSLISCAAVRRLRFEMQDGSYSDSRNLAGRTAIVALGLYGLLAQMDNGYYLRSGCDLIPIDEPKLEIIGRTMNETETYPINADVALESLRACVKTAEEQGLYLRKEKITAEADERLVTLIERSRLSRSGE